MYYFIDDQHKNNFFFLLKKYGFGLQEDGQHESAIYIAAIPDIFRLIEEDKFQKVLAAGISPLYTLTKWDDEKDDYVFSHPGLTGSTRQMAKVGLSLYNGFNIGLDEVFGSVTSREFIDAILQAIKIRVKYR